MKVFLPLVFEQSGSPKPVRFGLALYGQPMERHHQLMGAGVPIQNWYAHECCMPYPSFMPTLRGTDYVVPIEQVRKLAAAYPGRTWCLWNEPDMPTQDRTSPHAAIEQTRIWMDTIGPHGRIAGFGVGLQPNYDGWRIWLDEYWRLGGPLPKVHHVHIYAQDVVQWNMLYEQWQAWNAAHGSLPTIISEAGGNLYEDMTDGWWSIYYHLRQWVDNRVESVYLFTNQPELFFEVT